MKNPVLLYFLARIALFVVVLGILLALFPQQWLLAALFGTLISFSLSIFLLRKLRDNMSAHIYAQSQRRRDGLKKADQPDPEDKLLDGKSE